VSLYLSLEHAREQERKGSSTAAEVEALQIQHKLVFDVINEELAQAESRHAAVVQQLRSARDAAGGAPGSSSSAAAARGAAHLEAHLASSVRGRLKSTLSSMARNLEPELPPGDHAAMLSARAASLARADMRVGFLGDELENLAEEEALITALVADELAQELQQDALNSL